MMMAPRMKRGHILRLGRNEQGFENAFGCNSNLMGKIRGIQEWRCEGRYPINHLFGKRNLENYCLGILRPPSEIQNAQVKFRMLRYSQAFRMIEF